MRGGAIPALQAGYRADPVAAAFHRSEKRIKGLVGPLGCGKTSACCMEILMRSLMQKPYGGWRRTRWFVIRNTYPMLETSTIKTWVEWIPETVCPIKWKHPIEARMTQKLPDGTTVDMEVFFVALDREEDIRKLLSTDCTGVWLNEAREIDEEIARQAKTRTGRFPPERHGGPDWSGLLLDSNPSDEEHWLYRWDKGRQMGPFADFFHYPPPLIEEGGRYKPNPEALYVMFQPLKYEYWLEMCYNAPRDWVNVYVMGNYGKVKGGSPVYPEYNDSIHCARQPLRIHKALPLLLGWDLDLHPACIAAQLHPGPQLQIVAEWGAENMGLVQFIRDIVKPGIKRIYYGKTVYSWADPTSGSRRSGTDATTAYDILRQAGIPTRPAPTNDFRARREAIASLLIKLVQGGKPALLLSPECRNLRNGFMGDYYFPQVYKAATGPTSAEKPVKNTASHYHDALQYLVMGAMGSRYEPREVTYHKRTPRIPARRRWEAWV